MKLSIALVLTALFVNSAVAASLPGSHDARHHRRGTRSVCHPKPVSSVSSVSSVPSVPASSDTSTSTKKDPEPAPSKTPNVSSVVPHIPASSSTKKSDPSSTTTKKASTSTSTTTSQKPSETPAAPAHSGRKRGAAYNDIKLVQKIGSGKVGWGYNWFSAANGDMPDGATYYPMLWNTQSEKTSRWKADVEKAIAAAKGEKITLLYCNEPDLAQQANMSPEEAADGWMKYMQPYHGRATLTSCAVTNGPAPNMGMGWMDRFLDACKQRGCSVDMLASHIYAGADNAQYFKDYIRQFGQRYNLPVLWTEIGASSGTQEQKINLVNELIPFLEAEPSVGGYAYFMFGQGILTGGNGSLTALGKAYVGA